MTAETVEVSDLAIGDEIGSGGQATVYRTTSSTWPNMLFKHYRGHAPVDASLDALISWRSGLPYSDLEVLDTSASWPHARVVDNGVTIGVLIPEAPQRYTADVRGTRRLNEISYLAFGDRAAKLGLHTPNPAQRALIVASLANVMDLFDRYDVVHGDISFKNVLWTVQPSAGVYLLDCDGAKLRDLPPALPHVTTQHWTDPRLQAGEIAHPDAESDRLSLALVFYRSYFQARGDFTGGSISLAIPDHPPIDEPVRQLLSRALVDSAPRPTAAEWGSVAALTTLAAQPRPAPTTPLRTPPHSTTVDLVSSPTATMGLGSTTQAPHFTTTETVPQPTLHAALDSSSNVATQSNPLRLLLLALIVLISAAISFAIVRTIMG